MDKTIIFNVLDWRRINTKFPSEKLLEESFIYEVENSEEGKRAALKDYYKNCVFSDILNKDFTYGSYKVSVDHKGIFSHVADSPLILFSKEYIDSMSDAREGIQAVSSKRRPLADTLIREICNELGFIVISTSGSTDKGKLIDDNPYESFFIINPKAIKEVKVMNDDCFNDNVKVKLFLENTKGVRFELIIYNNYMNDNKVSNFLKTVRSKNDKIDTATYLEEYKILLRDLAGTEQLLKKIQERKERIEAKINAVPIEVKLLAEIE